MTKASAPKMQYLHDYRPADFIIDQVHLHFDLHEDQTIVHAILEMRRNPAAQTPLTPLVLDGEDMQLNRVNIDGKLLGLEQYTVGPRTLTIPNVPDQFKLETEVIITPQLNTQLMGLYKSRGNFCTQCEAKGFRRITYYLDRPDVMAQFTTTISADKQKYPMLLANGNLTDEKDLGNNRHWVRWEDPSKKPCYLFALVAGEFDLLRDSFTTMGNRKIDLRLYLEKGYADQGAFALDSLKKAMRWDEQAFGREYDLDIYMIVAVSDFNMGAMENKGLNIFNTKYILAKPDTATDTDYIGILNVIGHEYFHNWSGNRITCRDWFQITLKEGLTVLRDQLFAEDMTSASVMRINEVNVVRTQQFSEDAGPMAHPIRPECYIEVNNFYTSTVYRKGSEVIRMVRTLLTPSAFRKAMDLYFTRYDGQAVTTEDFIQAMADSSGKDFTQFRRWYGQAGTPRLDVSGEYNAQQQTFKLTIKQSCPATPGQPEKLPLHLPFSVGLVGNACNDLPLQLQDEIQASGTTRVLEITQPTHTFTFINVPDKPVPSLLRNFSAPVIVNYSYSNEELAWLMQCDGDAFARWDAGQTLAQRIIFSLAEKISCGDSLYLDPVYVDVVRQLLAAPPEDLSYLTRLLSLPSENYLLQRMVSVNVAALHRAVSFVRQQLALQLETHWRNYFEKFRSHGPYTYNPQAVGRRSFSNLCLSYLTETSKPQDFKLAYEHFIHADNMTDCFGALLALNDHDCSERESALATFYERWQHEPLVVNKWLLLQASSALPNALTRVQELMHHPGFDIHNPNKVYSLLCAFGANTARFHETTGAGYQFIADQVLAIDPKNPQVAARVIQPLTQWQRMDEQHANLMQQALRRVKNADTLSQDVYEIVTKSLTD